MANAASTEMEVRRLIGEVVSAPHRIAKFSLPDVDMVIRVARRARLLGRLAHRLIEADLLNALPQVAVDQLQGALAMADARKRLALWELDRIALATRNHSAPLVLMKGCTYVVLELPNAPGRTFADVDLLTAEEQLKDVETVLNDEGWETQVLSPYDQNYYRSWSHELPPLVHHEREVEVDLHHNVLPPTSRLSPSSEKLLERSVPLSDSRYHVLNDRDIVLHAMAHLMFGSDLEDKIRDLVDIHDLLIHFAERDETFWRSLIERAEELDLKRPAFYSLRYCQLLLHTPVPDFVVDSSMTWAPAEASGIADGRSSSTSTVPPAP